MELVKRRDASANVGTTLVLGRPRATFGILMGSLFVIFGIIWVSCSTRGASAAVRTKSVDHAINAIAVRLRESQFASYRVDSYQVQP